MTETLTYNSTPADQPEFTKDEQDSLQVAEKLGAEEAKQYAGKFNNAEDLENAYIEPQKKLGEADEDTEVDTIKEDLDEATSAGVSLITDASTEYFANEGQLSPETMNKFSEMSTTDLVNAYVELQKANPDIASAAPSRDLTDSEVNSVYNSAGGEAEYKRLVSWASTNIDDTKLGAFNSIVNNGDATAIQIAVAGLRSEYESQEGYEGRMLTGKAARAQDGFRSQAELVAAMRDPRYENDPAYQQDVYEKLERSNVQF